MSWYWIDIRTPSGVMELWSNGAPVDAFRIAKALGFRVAYGREGHGPSKSYPKGWLEECARVAETTPLGPVAIEAIAAAIKVKDKS